MQASETCLILNFNRCNTHRIIRRALRSLKDNEEALIVDLIWEKPFRHRGREIRRNTAVEIVSFEDMKRILKDTAEVLKRTINSVAAPADSPLPISSEHFHLMVFQSAVYRFFADLDIDYLSISNLIIEKINPARIIVVAADKNSQHIARLCHEKQVLTTVERPRDISGWLTRLFLPRAL